MATKVVAQSGMMNCCSCCSATVGRIVGLPTELSTCGVVVPRFRVSCRRDLNATETRRGAVIVRATSSGSGGGKKPGDNESKAVYDAFFLGKALAETINERVGSAVGEFLSDIGRKQAEQQKKIREFQDEVQERAAAAAVKAAQKALAVEKASKETKSSTSTSSPAQPPASTSGLSNPEDGPSSITIE